MSPAAVARSAVRVLHPALDPLASAAPLVRLSDARLSDQQRIAVILQAAGLLSLLDRAGWQPPAEWPASPPVGVGPGGRLVVAGVAPGRSGRPTQELLRDLITQLFRGEEGETLPGRGAARRAARVLQDAWRQSLAPVPADEAVSQVLEAAPFLWEPAFAAARRALVGELWTPRDGGEDRPRLWVAGPPGWRARLLAGCGDLATLQSLIAGDEARALWQREEAGDPRDLASSGRWRAAVAAW
ncbi:MAG TPA: hypothetical protein VEL74_00840, partial [Thermoanaerobaculia bacterium]|nr:hypothetical protein [Thermoanaerobaculia bacterium]